MRDSISTNAFVRHIATSKFRQKACEVHLAKFHCNVQNIHRQDGECDAYILLHQQRERQAYNPGMQPTRSSSDSTVSS